MPLPKQLGLRDGQHALIAVPQELEAITRFPGFAARVARDSHAALGDLPQGTLDLAHGFARERAFAAMLPRLAALITWGGMIRVTSPKSAARASTDLTEDVIRAQALALGLVDVKVCAVSPLWSRLKLAIPRTRRDG